MTLELEDIGIFKAELIAERFVQGMHFRLFENRIFYVKIERHMKISIDMIAEGYKFINENGGGKFHNIYHFDSFADVEPEVREWAADKEGNFNTITDAIVINSLPQKILADFYMFFNKPIMPTKVFFSLEKSVEWTLDIKKR